MSGRVVLQKALRRLCHIDSRRWIGFLQRGLRGELPAKLSEEEHRMLSMFHYAVWQRTPNSIDITDARAGLERVHKSQELCAEMLELLAWCYDRIAFVDKPVDHGFPCPLDLHCTYSRDEIMAALGHWNDTQRPEMREGVKWLPEQKTDILLINLNKTEKDFSPTTMYEDYATNETLFHWQSQSTTSATSPTGQRYIHREFGSQVLLFVREFKTVAGQAQPYIYLGKANYVKHTGSRPISIIWRLDEPMPAGVVGKAVQAGVV